MDLIEDLRAEVGDRYHVEEGDDGKIILDPRACMVSKGDIFHGAMFRADHVEVTLSDVAEPGRDPEYLMAHTSGGKFHCISRERKMGAVQMAAFLNRNDFEVAT